MVKDRILQRLEELNLKQVDLRNATGTAKSTVNAWVKGSTEPKGKNLLAVCSLLKVSPTWLLYGHEEENSPSHQSDDDSIIPIFKEVETVNGSEIVTLREHTARQFGLGKTNLRLSGVNQEDVAFLILTGNSMQPVLPEGASVAIDTTDKSINDGDMYAIDNNGALQVRVLQRLGAGKVRARCFNASEYPDEEYSLTSIKLLGRVFWYTCSLVKKDTDLHASI
jgi:phage repressor protein C with HTH and peptisase S24 domain